MCSVWDRLSLKRSGVVPVVMSSRQLDKNLEPKREIGTKDTDLAIISMNQQK